VQALHAVPAIVLTARTGGGLEVDLFVPVLSDVGDPEVAGVAVERETPRVPETVGPDLRTGARGVDERIAGRDPDAAGVALDVETQDLAEEGVGVLAVALRVAARPAIAEAEIEIGVGAEDELAAVVIRERLGLFEQHDLARGVGDVGVGADAVESNGGVAAKVGVVDVEALGLRE
jgi:hypothetical protein